MQFSSAATEHIQTRSRKSFLKSDRLLATAALGRAQLEAIFAACGREGVARFPELRTIAVCNARA